MSPIWNKGNKNQLNEFNYNTIIIKTSMGHFQKYQNTLCLPSKILHKRCFHFLLGLTMVPRENKNNAYAKFWRANKEYYGIFESGLYHHHNYHSFYLIPFADQHYQLATFSFVPLNFHAFRNIHCHNLLDELAN